MDAQFKLKSQISNQFNEFSNKFDMVSSQFTEMQQTLHNNTNAVATCGDIVSSHDHQLNKQ